MTTFLMALAGGIGALARVEVGNALRRGGHPMWATRAVNLVGAAALSAVVGQHWSPAATTIVGTGFLGGFTTFSTWMVEADRRGGRGRWLEVVVVLLLGLGLGSLVSSIG